MLAQMPLQPCAFIKSGHTGRSLLLKTHYGSIQEPISVSDGMRSEKPRKELYDHNGLSSLVYQDGDIIIQGLSHN